MRELGRVVPSGQYVADASTRGDPVAAEKEVRNRGLLGEVALRLIRRVLPAHVCPAPLPPMAAPETETGPVAEAPKTSPSAAPPPSPAGSPASVAGPPFPPVALTCTSTKSAPAAVSTPLAETVSPSSPGAPSAPISEIVSAEEGAAKANTAIATMSSGN